MGQFVRGMITMGGYSLIAVALFAPSMPKQYEFAYLLAGALFILVGARYFIMLGASMAYQKLFLETPDGPFESAEEGRLWLLERGYHIVHEYDKHIIGQKDSLVPGVAVLTEVQLTTPPDEILQAGDPEKIQELLEQMDDE